MASSRESAQFQKGIDKQSTPITRSFASVLMSPATGTSSLLASCRTAKKTGLTRTTSMTNVPSSDSEPSSARVVPRRHASAVGSRTRGDCPSSSRSNVKRSESNRSSQKEEKTNKPSSRAVKSAKSRPNQQKRSNNETQPSDQGADEKKKAGGRKSRGSGKRNRTRHSSVPTKHSALSSIESQPKRFGQVASFALEDLFCTPTRPSNLHEVAVSSAKLKPIDENKYQKSKKCREEAKPKRPTRLKRILRQERQQRASSAPGDVDLSLVETKHRNPQNSTSSECCSQETRDQVTKAMQNMSALSLSAEQEAKVAELLSKLTTFQDNAYTRYAHAPFYRKRTRRMVCGLREVLKHLKLKHLSMVILARDLERDATERCYVLKDVSDRTSAEEDASTLKSGTELPILERTLQQIWSLATHQDPYTPIVIAKTRRSLAKLCHKPGRVSIVGILSTAGAEDLSREMLAMDIAINTRPAEGREDDGPILASGHPRSSRSTVKVH